MIKFQSKTLRGGYIGIGSERYPISQSGQVEVSEEAARRLRQGANWIEIGEVNNNQLSYEDDSDNVTESNSINFDNMTKSDLIKMANELGLNVDPKISKMRLVQVIKTFERG